MDGLAGIVAYVVPFMFVYSPTLLAQGSPKVWSAFIQQLSAILLGLCRRTVCNQEVGLSGYCFSGQDCYSYILVRLQTLLLFPLF